MTHGLLFLGGRSGSRIVLLLLVLLCHLENYSLGCSKRSGWVNRVVVEGKKGGWDLIGGLYSRLYGLAGRAWWEGAHGPT